MAQWCLVVRGRAKVEPQRVRSGERAIVGEGVEVGESGSDPRKASATKQPEKLFDREPATLPTVLFPSIPVFAQQLPNFGKKLPVLPNR